MAVLYVNPRGLAHRRHSYSAGLDWAQSPRKYYLRRIMGWVERDNKAAFLFGRALEQAIEYFHDNSGRGGLEKFIELWAQHKDTPGLVFTKTERDWASLDKAGQEMLRLYAIRQPSLPIPLGGGSVFQREYVKSIFEGDEKYGDLEFGGKVDLISYVNPSHPMLPRINWKPEYGLLRPSLTDIKTSALDLPERPGMAAFDKQLRVYSWLTGIRDCSLLWFKKTSHTLSKGSSVTLLEDMGRFKAGDEAVVAQLTTIDGVWLVGNDYNLEEMADAQGRKEDGSVEQTKVAKERKAKWLEQNAVQVPERAVTRQRLQFNAGFVTIESANEMGILIAKQMLDIADAWEKKQYPSNFGIRFPHDDQRDPYFRAFILQDEVYKEEHFKQTEHEEDLFDEPEEGQ